MVVTAIQAQAAARYSKALKHYGVPEDQSDNYYRSGVAMHPQQMKFAVAAREADKASGPSKIGLGGARGGGKSFGMLAQMGCDDCQRYPGLKCLLLRKVGKANKENFEDLRRRLFRALPHKYNRQEGILRFENDSNIIAGHFQHESDIDAYLGLEYDVIGIEEATTLTASKHQDIQTCNRTSKPDWRPRTYNTFNPGGVGHAHIKKTFVEPFRRHEETDTRFIPSLAKDNPFLNPEYIRQNLESLTGWKRRAWLDGDWDIAAGQFFTTFNQAIHVVPWFMAPKGWTFWGAIDYGFTHYTVFYLLAQDGDGNIYILDEHGERGWLPQRHVPAIEALLARNGLQLWQLQRIVAGADVFAKKGSELTIADTYEALGMALEVAEMDRINGAGQILTLLGDWEAQPPIPAKLFITDRCARLIETLPSLEHDPHRPQDVLKVDVDENGDGGDDWYDGARYGVMAALPAAIPAQAGPVPARASGYMRY